MQLDRTKDLGLGYCKMKERERKSEDSERNASRRKAGREKEHAIEQQSG